MIDQIKRAQKQFRLLCWINGLTVDFDWVVGDALQHLVIHGDATSSGEVDMLMLVTDWLPALIGSGRLSSSGGGSGFASGVEVEIARTFTPGTTYGPGLPLVTRPRLLGAVSIAAVVFPSSAGAPALPLDLRTRFRGAASGPTVVFASSAVLVSSIISKYSGVAVSDCHCAIHFSRACHTQL